MVSAVNSFISIKGLIWLFLPLFLIHDLEEIITVESWYGTHESRLKARLPRIIQTKIDAALSLKSSQFAVAVLLELTLLLPFTYLAAEKDTYLWFLSANVIFFLHVFTHVAQSVRLKTYTPGVVTAIAIVLPYTSYLFWRLTTEGTVNWQQLYRSLPVGLLLLPVVLLGHWLGKRIA